MAHTNLLVISPPDHYALRNLTPLRDRSNVSISNDLDELKRLAVAAEVVLYCGFGEQKANLAQLWQQMKSVRWVHSVSAGVEKMLFPELIHSNVIVTNARGVFRRALAEFAALGMLYHFKEVRRLVDNQREKKWDDSFRVKFARLRVMGIVGYGETGRECAILAKGLGLKILALRRNSEKSASDPIVDRLFRLEKLHEMLAETDVLVCAAPLTAETHHMISDAQFNVMKATAIVINVGRGPVIDEGALIRALQSHRIAGASLDVFEEEPLPASSPLWDMRNVLISPHCTDCTDEPGNLDLSMQFFVENFHRYQQGEVLKNVVDKSAGY